MPSGLNFSSRIKKVKTLNQHANMKFTFSNPDYSGLVDKFEWANSALIFAYDYKNKVNISNLTNTGYGQIARFAQQDFYLPLKKNIKKFEDLFNDLNIRNETFIDNPNHYDRSLFEKSGMGWQGKSTMMLTPGIGPWQLLGTIYVEINFLILVYLFSFLSALSGFMFSLIGSLHPFSRKLSLSLIHI